MNVVHAHLVVNHVPIVATWLAVPLLVLALWRLPNRDTWLSAVVLLLIAGASAGITLWTGEGAEEAIEGIPSVSETQLEEHEERGKMGAAAAITAGAAAACGWVLGRRNPRSAVGSTLALALVSGSVLAWVGYSGGLIRHPEIHERPPGPATL